MIYIVNMFTSWIRRLLSSRSEKRPLALREIGQLLLLPEQQILMSRLVGRVPKLSHDNLVAIMLSAHSVQVSRICLWCEEAIDHRPYLVVPSPGHIPLRVFLSEVQEGAREVADPIVRRHGTLGTQLGLGTLSMIGAFTPVQSLLERVVTLMEYGTGSRDPYRRFATGPTAWADAFLHHVDHGPDPTSIAGALWRMTVLGFAIAFTGLLRPKQTRMQAYEAYFQLWKSWVEESDAAFQTIARGRNLTL